MSLQESHSQLVTQLVNAHGVEYTSRALARMSGYEDAPPTIDTFIDDNFFLGDIIGGAKLYPTWRSALYEIFPNPYFSQYSSVIATGSIGGGKSTFCLAGMAYDLCKILYVKNPQEKYKLIKSTKIVFALINATLSLAGGVLYDQLSSWIAESPFFKKQLAANHGSTMFPKNVTILTGSRFGHVLGMAIISAILSELNFQSRVANQAYDNYTNVKRRLQSRFLNNGSYPGRVWLDSSKTDDISFVDQQIADSVNDPSVKVYDYPIWEIQQHKGIYTGEKFKVFVGDSNRDPIIISGSTNLAGLDEAKIIDVPVEYHKEFVLDIYNSLRDLAGIGTYSSHKFITSTELINKAFSRPNPCYSVVLQLDFFDQNQQIIDSIDWNALENIKVPRFIHIDLGLKNDKTGIAISRADGSVRVSRYDVITGKVFFVDEPVFVTDLVICIESKPGQEVPIYKIKSFILNLMRRGMTISGVSTDGYQSSNLRQDLTMLEIPTALVSVDRTKVPYETLKSAILEQRYSGPNHPILMKEIEELVDTGAKVDHQISGCFVGETLVKTNVGNKSIRDIRPNDIVKSFNIEARVFEDALVINSGITKYVDELIELEFDDVIYKCTPEHLVLLISGEYIQAQHLTLNDEIVSF